MNPPPAVPFASFTKMAQARAVFRGGDFARDAGVIERGHVHQVAPGQRDVAGDARAFLAERLFGDLHDDFLPLLEHVGNQLRAARLRAMMPVSVAGVRHRAAGGGRGRRGGRDRGRRGGDAACARENRCARAR